MAVLRIVINGIILSAPYRSLRALLLVAFADLHPLANIPNARSFLPPGRILPTRRALNLGEVHGCLSSRPSLVLFRSPKGCGYQEGPKALTNPIVMGTSATTIHQVGELEDRPATKIHTPKPMMRAEIAYANALSMSIHERYRTDNAHRTHRDPKRS
jgi:hypothetical protein